MATKTTTYRRQSRIYDPEKHNMPVTIIGGGSLGGWIAECMTRLGVLEFILWDADKVEKHNIPNQPFRPSHEGKSKVDTLKSIMEDINKDVKCVVHNKFWTPDDKLETPVIVSAADSIKVRQLVAQHAPKNALIIDVRSGTEAFDVFFCKKNNQKEWDFYNQFFFDEKDVAEADCNLQMVGYSSQVIAGLAVNGFIRHARGDKRPSHVTGLLNEFDFEAVRL